MKLFRRKNQDVPPLERVDASEDEADQQQPADNGERDPDVVAHTPEPTSDLHKPDYQVATIPAKEATLTELTENPEATVQLSPEQTKKAQAEKQLEPARRKKTSYDQETIDAGLLCLIACAGNSRLASARLAEQGIEVPFGTLYDWKTKVHADRYLELAQTKGREIEDVATATIREVVHRAAHVTLQAVEEAERQLEHGDVKDAGRFSKDMMTTAAIGSDKLLLLTGRPNHISAEAGSEQILEAFAKKHPHLIVEGTAEEIPDTGLEQGEQETQ